MKVASIEKKAPGPDLAGGGILPADWALPLLSAISARSLLGSPHSLRLRSHQLVQRRSWSNAGAGAAGVTGSPNPVEEEDAGRGLSPALHPYPCCSLPTRPSLLQGRCSLALP